MKIVLKNKPNQHDENQKFAISKIFAFSIDRLKYVEEGKEDIWSFWKNWLNPGPVHLCFL